MPFARPTLKTLIDRSIADINARVPGADARLAFSDLNILAMVEAVAVHGLYGYLDYLALQLMIDTAEAAYLDRYADIWGVPRQAAVAANGNLIITGTSGVTVPTGTAFQRADGIQFLTTVDVIMASGTGTVNVVASAGGATTNTLAGVTLNIVSPITNINATATVASGGLSSGTDLETDTSLRARLLDRIQTPPQGGSANDYVTWAKEVPGVTRAWVASLGDGYVTVRFVRDNDVSIIPDSGEVAAVQAYIDSKRPVTANVTVVAPTPAPINFTLAVTPNTTTVKNAVIAELADLLIRVGVPGNTVLLSWIRAAISGAQGEIDYNLASPSANVTNTANQIPTLGTVTFT